MSHLKETELLALAREPGKKRPAHLATCLACREKLAATERLVAHVQAPFPLPDDLSERTFRALPAPKPTARPLWKPLALGTAAAALAGVGVFALLPGGPVRPTPSFAQVEKAMRKVRTATWIETRYEQKSNFKTENMVTKTEIWIQMKPPMMSIKNVSGERSQSLITESRSISVRTNTNLWIVSNLMDSGGNGQPRNLTQILYAWWDDLLNSPEASDSISQEKKLGNSIMRWSPWQERDSVNGILRFERTKDHITSNFTSRTTEKVEVDTQQHRVTRREESAHIVPPVPANVLETKSRTLSENFRYDIAPPKKAFALTLPVPNKPYVLMDLISAKKKVPFSDQQAARQILDTASDAWRQHNIEGFLKLWDWNSQSVLEKSKFGNFRAGRMSVRDIWKTEVRIGRPYPNWEIESIDVNPGAQSVETRFSNSEPFPPKHKQLRSLDVKGTIWVWGAQRRRQGIRANLQRQPDGTFKLTDLELSSRR